MRKKIDKNQLLRLVYKAPPSPRNTKINILGVASFVFYGLAGFCAWKFGDWWGIGFIVSLFFVDFFNQLVQDEYRQELIDMHENLLREIADNSDVLDHLIPKKE